MMTQRKILIIDDHQDFRRTLRSFIETRFKGLEIKEAHTGEEGVKIAKAEKPDVSLIDIRLSGIDGIETARQIKEQVPGCRIIAMSMFKETSMKEIISQGDISFVNKSEIDVELIPLLNRCLMTNDRKTEKTTGEER